MDEAAWQDHTLGFGLLVFGTMMTAFALLRPLVAIAMVLLGGAGIAVIVSGVTKIGGSLTARVYQQRVERELGPPPARLLE
jgi:hypothetical protein